MYYLSACAVVKDEAPYIAEWVEFHLLQGVEHFYIFDNSGDDDSTWRALRPYTFHPSLITYKRIDRFPPQFVAYNQMLYKFGHETKWCAFIDIDEFLYYPGNFLKNKLETLESYAGVAVNWYLYGSNGLVKKDDRLVVERFTKRAAKLNQHVKSIMQPYKTLSVGADPHSFYPVPDYDNPMSIVVVNENGKPLTRDYALQPKGTADYLRINHYVTKSYEEAMSRWINPDPGSGVPRPTLDKRFKEHDVNEVEDLTAQSYASEIRQALKDRECL